LGIEAPLNKLIQAAGTACDQQRTAQSVEQPWQWKIMKSPEGQVETGTGCNPDQ
jgi:hypothetical protein